uniref:Uncharacterized protein n=1 Tax=Periophthalmus magnuspinnatus TaxID=409849 RepID=A0A3B4AX22_9GOBI
QCLSDQETEDELETEGEEDKESDEEEESPFASDQKYNSLIQAQARELSHLRQRIREGQGVCHILSQHLGDTTKTFEELLRSNDIDYYMGQSFREQLAQSTALAQRVVAKISGSKKEPCEITLQLILYKNDCCTLILHCLQHRAETPSSCHALSETTDQSDRTSLVSDEFQGTEDLELCSEADRPEYPGEHSLQPGRFGSEQRGMDDVTGVLYCSEMLINSDQLYTMAFNTYIFSGMHLIEEHLQEVKCLRQRLEESIRTNERLRQQLEERLASTGREGGIVHIFIKNHKVWSLVNNVNITVFKEHLQTSTFKGLIQLRNCPMRLESLKRRIRAYSHVSRQAQVIQLKPREGLHMKCVEDTVI